MTKSDNKIIKININKESGFDVIKRIEEALEMSKSGLIDDIFIVATGTNNTVMRSWANGNKPFTMLGAIEDAKEEYRLKNIDH